MKPRLLDLFCGAGGATKGYQEAGFYVIGVDHKPQPRYVGDEFILDDALEYVAKHGHEYDAIHASPPCQAYCALKTMKNARKHPDLIAKTRRLLHRTGKYWVIENVYGAPLINAFMLCGSHFDLASQDGYGLQRHRYFEANFSLPILYHPCRHRSKTVGIYGDKARDIAKEKRHYSSPKTTRGKPNGIVLPRRVASEAMGITWMNMKELSEAIPPAYCRFIGEQLMRHIGRRR